MLNSSNPRQNVHHFADNILKCIFMREKNCILIQISLKFVHKGPIDNKSALVQVMAWRRTGDKPLPQPMLTLFTDVKATIRLRSPSLQEVAGLLFSLGGSYEAHSQLTRLSDENRRMLEQTRERSDRVFLRTGSSAEGLALVDLPGTVTSDIDLLCLMPSPYDVSITGEGPLSLHTDNCPPGYTRISVNQKCDQYIDPFFIHHAKNRLYLWADAVKEASGSLWEERCGHMACHKSYHGAALRISVCDNTQELDLSHGIICDAPFEVMDEFLHRKRSTYWLNTFQLHRITKQRGGACTKSTGSLQDRNGSNSVSNVFLSTGSPVDEITPTMDAQSCIGV